MPGSKCADLILDGRAYLQAQDVFLWPKYYAVFPNYTQIITEI